MKNCWIVGAGDFEPEGFAPERGEMIIAVDGGYRYLRKMGIAPELVVGDFDSLGEAPVHNNIIRAPVMKDYTDTMLAAEKALEAGCSRLLIFGGYGGRFDHTIANIQLLAHIARQGAEGFLFGGGNVITALRDGALRFSGGYSGMISVFCHGGTARGVSLTGLLYPLSDARLTDENPLGVSNEFTGAPAEISVGDGTLIVIWRASPRDILPERAHFTIRNKPKERKNL